jgi:hypothetical protein
MFSLGLFSFFLVITKTQTKFLQFRETDTYLSMKSMDPVAVCGCPGGDSPDSFPLNLAK